MKSHIIVPEREDAEQAEDGAENEKSARHTRDQLISCAGRGTSATILLQTFIYVFRVLPWPNRFN